MSLVSIGAAPCKEWLARHTNSSLASVIDFLHTDIRETSAPALDPAALALPCFRFGKTTLLQVDEIVNITVPLHDRLELKNTKGTMKMLVSDGFCSTAAITKDEISEIQPRLVPGVKIMVRQGTEMRFGVILIRKENVEVLGGRSALMSDRRMKMLVYDPVKRHQADMKKTQDKPMPAVTAGSNRTTATAPKIMPLTLVPEKRSPVFLTSESDEIDIDCVAELQNVEDQPRHFLDPLVVEVDSSAVVSGDEAPTEELTSVYFKERNALTWAEFRQTENREGIYNVECRVCDNQNLTIVRRSGTLCFLLKVRICDPANPSNSCMASISSNIIATILDTDPPTWMLMDEDEQITKWTQLLAQVRKAGPVITVDVSRHNQYLSTSIISLHGPST